MRRIFRAAGRNSAPPESIVQKGAVMSRLSRVPLVATTVGWMLVAGLAAGGEPRSKVLLNPKFDPDAEQVELFAALEAGRIAARMLPRNADGGALFLENLTDRPLTVVLPEAVVGVQVLPQFANVFQNTPPTGPGANAGPGAGPNQPIGTGFPPGGTGPGGIPNVNVNLPLNGPPGQNFFSIPPERIVRVPYHSVCLRHGAVEPKQGNVYRLVRVEEFSADPRLPELLRLVGSQAESQAALQAAAWHIANGMSWEELEAKRFRRAAAPDTPYFRRAELNAARQIVKRVEALAQRIDEPRDVRLEPKPLVSKTGD
jgi:hypothetical protein